MRKMGIGHFGITQASLAFLTPPRRRERHGRLVEEGICVVEDLMANASSEIVTSKLSSKN